MPSIADIKTVVEQIPTDTEVVVKLRDGTEIRTKLRGVNEDRLLYGETDEVALADVEGMLLEGETEGPE